MILVMLAFAVCREMGGLLMCDEIAVGEVVDIPKLGKRKKHSKIYKYHEDASKCPVCGDLGMPWGGWFSCEDPTCGAVALVESGEVFVPLDEDDAG